MSSRCFNGAYLKWWAGIDIRDILLANEEVSGITGGNVYPVVAPEGTEGNFILYRRVNYKREYSQMGLTSDVARIEFLAIADSYEESVTMAALLDSTLTGKHTNEFGDSLTFTLNDSEESFDDMKYIQTLTFEIK